MKPSERIKALAERLCTEDRLQGQPAVEVYYFVEAVMQYLDEREQSLPVEARKSKKAKITCTDDVVDPDFEGFEVK